jgi:phage terminase small subunit
MTPKQLKFIDEYLIDLNATQAAIRAGYSAKTAGQIGEQNLKKLEIAFEIEKRKSEQSKTAWLTREKVLNDIELIKADAMQRIYDKDGNQVMANHAAALKAAELHGKHLGMLNDKLNIEGGISINVITGVDG